jgi:hypothetical protein
MKKSAVERWQLGPEERTKSYGGGFARNSRSESLGSSSLCFCRLYRSVPWRRAGFERVEKTSRDGCYFIHGSQEASFVCLRRLVDSTDFSDELERRCPNLFRGNGRLEVEKSLDVSAHRLGPYAAKFKHFNPAWILVAAIRPPWAKGHGQSRDRKFTRPGGPG